MTKEEQCCKRSLFGSLWDTAKKVVKDPVPVPDDVQEQRMAVCHSCDKFLNGRCVECGCYMRIKTQFSEVECPIGKWGKYTRPSLRSETPTHNQSDQQ